MSLLLASAGFKTQSSSPSGNDFTISPAVNGKTTWSLSTDGALNIGTYGEYTITMLRTVTVDAKFWGGGGGPGGQYDGGYPPSGSIGPGGGGGYATGRMQLTNGSTFKLRVGQGGGRTNVATNTGATYLKGGSVGAWSSEGAGYTGIFITSATQANAWLIAGGGGGGGDTRYLATGGAGGGTTGQDGYVNQGGTGGTQSAGGSPSIYNGATAGSALTGGKASDNQGTGSMGGGGGGYYGGGGGNVGNGGGGSGYFKSGTVSSATLTTGSNSTPGNSADAARSGSGQGGSGATAGTDGRAIMTFVSVP